MNEIEAFANRRSSTAVEQLRRLMFEGPVLPVGCLQIVQNGVVYAIREWAQAEVSGGPGRCRLAAKAVHGAAGHTRPAG